MKGVSRFPKSLRAEKDAELFPLFFPPWIIPTMIALGDYVKQSHVMVSPMLLKLRWRAFCEGWKKNWIPLSNQLEKNVLVVSLVVITMTERQLVVLKLWLVEFILWKGTSYMLCSFFLLSDTSRLPCTKWTTKFFGHGAQRQNDNGSLDGWTPFR
jgi:hypothetical protein